MRQNTVIRSIIFIAIYNLFNSTVFRFNFDMNEQIKLNNKRVEIGRTLFNVNHKLVLPVASH